MEAAGFVGAVQAVHAGDKSLALFDSNKEELKTTRAACQSHSTRGVLRDVSAGLRGPSSQPCKVGPGTIYSLPEALRTLTEGHTISGNRKDRTATLTLKVTYKYLGHTGGKAVPGGHLLCPAVWEAG